MSTRVRRRQTATRVHLFIAASLVGCLMLLFNAQANRVLRPAIPTHFLENCGEGNENCGGTSALQLEEMKRHKHHKKDSTQDAEVSMLSAYEQAYITNHNDNDAYQQGSPNFLQTSGTFSLFNKVNESTVKKQLAYIEQGSGSSARKKDVKKKYKAVAWLVRNKDKIEAAKNKNPDSHIFSSAWDIIQGEMSD